MLSDYYREDGERLYDMNFMATNFVSTFDPFMTFTDDPDFVGAMNTSGMTDEQLIDMTWDMHKTEPYDADLRAEVDRVPEVLQRASADDADLFQRLL